jgi:hypothetical protein
MRKYKIGIISVILLMVAFGACGDNSYGRTPKSYTFQTKLTARDGAAVDEFGSSVAVSGDTIVIGAHGDDGDDDNETESGSVYVYRVK